MDPTTLLGAAAAASQFLVYGVKGVSVAYELYSQFQDVPQAIRSRVQELDSFNQVARRITVTSQLRADGETEKILRQCTRVVEQLTAILQKIKGSADDTRVVRLWKTATGLSHENEIISLFETLQRAKTTVLLHIETVNSDILKLIKDDIALNNEHLAAMQARLNQAAALGDHEERVFFSRLFITDSRDDRAALISAKGKRVEGTCTWILDTPQYQRWTEGLCQSLWIIGGPGKGKTMMSIFLSHELERLADCADDTTVIFFFCDNRNDKRNNFAAILRGLVWQLARLRPHLLHHCLGEFRLRINDFPGPSPVEMMWRMFRNMVEDPDAGTIYCMIDGLDECDDASIEELGLKFVDLLGSSDPGLNRLKLLIFSRPVNDYQSSILHPLLRIRLDPDSDHEVSEDLKTFIQRRVAELAVEKHYSPDLRALVNEAFIQRSHGTFLWVGFVAQDLRKKTNNEVAQSLDTLPAGLDALYGAILLKVKKEAANVVRLILTWAATVTQPLTLPELGEVIKLRKGYEDTTEELVTDILGYCGHFLVVLEGKVQLVHQSAKDYLRRDNIDPNEYVETFRVKMPEANLEVAKGCITYLQSGALSHGPVAFGIFSSVKSISTSIITQYPLVEYAVKNWTHHARESGELLSALLDQSASLLAPDSKLRQDWLLSYTKGVSKPTDTMAEQIGIVKRGIPSHYWEEIHLGAFFGLLPLVRMKLTRSGRLHALGLRRTIAKQTALHIAASVGHRDIVQLLIDRSRGTNLSVRDTWGYTPLHWAVAGQHVSCLRALLKANARTDTDVDGNTPLHTAIEGRNLEVVKTILEYGADINASGCDRGHWPLLWATRWWSTGSIDMILDLLLSHGADPNSQDLDGDTALHFASEWGQAGACRKLIAAGADHAHANKLGEIPAHIAALEGHCDVLDVLMTGNYNPDRRNFHNETPLMYAAHRGHQNVVGHLISKGAFVNAVDEEGNTALHISVEQCHLAMAEALLQHGADKTIRNYSSETPLDISSKWSMPLPGPITRRQEADRNLRQQKPSTIKDKIKALLEYDSTRESSSRDSSYTLLPVYQRVEGLPGS